jgi:hypothetical protein
MSQNTLFMDLIPGRQIGKCFKSAPPPLPNAAETALHTDDFRQLLGSFWLVARFHQLALMASSCENSPETGNSLELPNFQSQDKIQMYTPSL